VSQNVTNKTRVSDWNNINEPKDFIWAKKAQLELKKPNFNHFPKFKILAHNEVSKTLPHFQPLRIKNMPILNRNLLKTVDFFRNFSKYSHNQFFKTAYMVCFWLLRWCSGNVDITD
jgi:hypothetical protein